MRQIVLDTETTGLTIQEGHRIIEIGCVELINRKITGNKFHQYLNPERDITQDAFAIHGLSNDFLKAKPLFAEIAHEFLEFLGNSELIIHNAAFDLTFIQNELHLTQKSYPIIKESCKIVDTLALARQLHTGQRNNLDALCKRYGIDNSERDLHGALLDAHLLAEVYLAMTGGQSSLFDELPKDNYTPSSVSKHEFKNNINHKKLFILKAFDEEIMAHEQLLNEIKEKGQCVWLED